MRGKLVLFVLVLGVAALLGGWEVSHNPQLFIGGPGNLAELKSVPRHGGFDIPHEVRVCLTPAPVLRGADHRRSTVHGPATGNSPKATAAPEAAGTNVVSLTPSGFRFGRRDIPGTSLEITAEHSPAIWVEDHLYRGRVRLSAAGRQQNDRDQRATAGGLCGERRRRRDAGDVSGSGPPSAGDRRADVRAVSDSNRASVPCSTCMPRRGARIISVINIGVATASGTRPNRLPAGRSPIRRPAWSACGTGNSFARITRRFAEDARQGDRRSSAIRCRPSSRSTAAGAATRSFTAGARRFPSPKFRTDSSGTFPHVGGRSTVWRRSAALPSGKPCRSRCSRPATGGAVTVVGARAPAAVFVSDPQL